VDTRQNKGKQNKTHNSGHKTEFVLFCLPLFCLVSSVACVFIGIRCCLFCFVCLCSVLCPLLLVSLLEFGVVCFVLFAFVLPCVHCYLCLYWNSVLSVLFCLLFSLSCFHCCLCLYWNSVLSVLFCLPLFCLVSTVICVFIGIRCCVFCFVCLLQWTQDREQRQTKQNRQHRIPIKTQVTVDTRQNKGKQNKTDNTE
jgi:hypothetical protein